MSRLNLRRKPRISYYEPEEPNLDEYVYCEKCGDFVFEYCAIHGPLLVIPDTKVPSNTGYPSFVPRAALTIPGVFLHIAPSIIPGAGLGVFTTLTLPSGVRFGPYRGKRTDEITSTYCWQLYSESRKRRVVVDAEDTNSSNWMRYVNCSRHWCEQNLIAYQYQGDIYYRTIKIIPKFTELMVFYGSEFANLLEVDLRRYNSPAGYAAKYGAPSVKKSKITHVTIQDKTTITAQDKNTEEERKHRNIEIGKIEEENDTPNIEDVDVKKLDSSNVKQSSNYNVSNIENFICDDCGKAFNNKTVLSDHIQQHNAIKTKIYLNCHFCKYQGITIKCLEKHMKCHNQSSIPKISKQCLSLNIVNNKPPERYLRTRNGEKPFECTICEYRFRDKSHLKIHSGEKPFKCTICEYRFRDKSHLKRHLKIHSGEKPFECTICDYRCSDKSSLKRHLKIHSGEKPFECTICEYRFRDKSHLKRHLKIHSGEKPFECTICEYRFRDKSNLKRHLKIHSGEKPFKCTICEYRFRDKSHLKRHLKIHSGEKPFECTICDYRCSDKSSLKRHLRSHTGEKPFECTICEYRCNEKGYLKIHLRVHSGEKPFECTICEYRCSRKSSLKRHLIIHSGEKPLNVLYVSTDVIKKVI